MADVPQVPPSANGAHGANGHSNGKRAPSKAPAKTSEPPAAPKRPALRSLPTGPNATVPTEDASRALEIFDNSDTGNAERLARRFGKHIRYVAAWHEFIVHSDRWKRDTDNIKVGQYGKVTISRMNEEVQYLEKKQREALENWRKKSASRSARSAMVDLLKQEEGIAIDHELLDADPWLLNVANGTLNLQTGKLQLHNPLDYITKLIRIDYNPKAKAPRWEKFLKEVLPDKSVRDFVHRFVGYCLTGDVSERMFVIFLGSGSNGKTAFINAIEDVMGSYATTAAPTLLMAKDRESHPTEIADLFRVRLATINETRKGATFDEERVKRLTGTDRLKARRMHEDFWEFDPTHKLLNASNHKPRVKDATDSFWDRVAIVMFKVRITKNKMDKKLAAKLRTEREGILAWMVEGCRLWLKDGLAAPDAVKTATQEYRDEEDIIGRFLGECCEADKKAFTFTSDIMRANKQWAEANNLFPASPKDLAAKLKSEPFNCVPVRNNNAGWKGVRLLKSIKK